MQPLGVPLPAQPDVLITLDTLHLVFSAFGLVQKIATFEKGQGFQALVQYSDPATAEQARACTLLQPVSPAHRLTHSCTASWCIRLFAGIKEETKVMRPAVKLCPGFACCWCESGTREETLMLPKVWLG
jgi:hypothetical protein